MGQISQDAFADSGDEELSPLVRSAIQLVRKYYDQGITLEETADRLFVSEEYLSTQFKKRNRKRICRDCQGTANRADKRAARQHAFEAESDRGAHRICGSEIYEPRV